MLVTRTEGIYPDSVSVENTEERESIPIDSKLLRVDGWIERVFGLTRERNRGIHAIKSR